MRHQHHFRNIKTHLLIIILIGVTGVFINFRTFGNEKIEILFFYEEGCPHCARIHHFLQHRIKPNYPVLIRNYEIHDPDHATLLSRLASMYDKKVKTPSVFIGNHCIQHDDRQSLLKIERFVREATRNPSSSPLNHLKQNRDQESVPRHITIPAVIGAAAVDAINPCAFAVLTFLLGTILLKRRNTRKIIGAGVAFTSATFISYLLMGIGLYKAIRIASIQHYVYIAVAILAILLGLVNIKDYFWYGRGIGMGLPEKWRFRMRQLIAGITTIPGAFVTGFLVSLFLLPCTSGPYVVIIGMLSQSAVQFEAIWLLLLYNVIFVFPFIVITLIVGFGIATTTRLEEWRQKRIETFHLLAGAVMLILGITMIALVATKTI